LAQTQEEIEGCDSLRDPGFPPNVVSFAQKNDICLIIRLEFFRVLVRVMADGGQGPAVRAAILSTAGLLNT
jgi:hypothetical protein